MLVGVPKEIKNNEFRVGLTPPSVHELVARGHRVIVQAGAGAGIGLTDEQYTAAGATIVPSAQEIFAQAEMVVKVKEPQTQECAMLRPGQILYTYLHLAPDPEQTAALVKSGAVCIAYETITGPGGGLPLLAPMSEVAGRMAIQAGASHLEKSKGGAGILLGGVPGVAAGHIVIIGAGVVGTNALQMAVGIGARVTVLDKNVDRLRQLDLIYGNRITTLYSNAHAIEEAVLSADLVIGGVLVPGAAAPKLVTRAMVARFKAQGEAVTDYTAKYASYFANATITRQALTAAIDGGAKKLYGEYTDGAHDIWSATYDDPLVARWLFKQTRTANGTGIAAFREDAARRGSLLVFPGDDMRAVAAALAPGAAYSLRVTDVKGEVLARATVKGGAPLPASLAPRARGLLRIAVERL